MILFLLLFDAEVVIHTTLILLRNFSCILFGNMMKKFNFKRFATLACIHDAVSCLLTLITVVMEGS